MHKVSHEILQNLVGSAHAASVRTITETLHGQDSPIKKLSVRELQIFIAIGTGLQPVQASKRLGIAVKSFSTYRARVMEKLNLESNAEIAVLAFELKLVPSILSRYVEEQK